MKCTSWPFLIRYGTSSLAGIGFAGYHPGTQWAGAADSISSNIAEGYGRFHFRIKLNFYYYSPGSNLESKDWIYEAHYRCLVDEAQYLGLMSELEVVLKS